MPDGKPDRGADDGSKSRWALVNLAVALMLLLAVGAVRLGTDLAGAAGQLLLAALGVLALVFAGFLFRSFLRR